MNATRGTIFVDDSLILTDSIGKITIPNNKMDEIIWQINLPINSSNDTILLPNAGLDSNTAYQVFVNDCLMSIMNDKELYGIPKHTEEQLKSHIVTCYGDKDYVIKEFVQHKRTIGVQ